jgi:hypothetical protein
MAASPASQVLIRGAAFLLVSSRPDEILTPADLSDE